MTTGRRTLLICVLLSAVTLLAYVQVAQNDFIKLDDGDYITANPRVLQGLSWSNLAWAFGAEVSCNWHPLTLISHMVDVDLFGTRPAGHHLMSLLIHTINTLLLFLLLQRWTAAPLRSAMVAMLFAIHPLHVESVAWASERKDVLSTMFFLLTLGAYCQYASVASVPRPSVPSAQNRSGGRVPARPSIFYWLAIVSFVLATMSKPMVMTTPFVLLLLDFWPLRRWDWNTAELKALRVILLEKIPFLLLAIVSGLIALSVQSHGAVRSDLPLNLRLGNAVVSYVKYLAHLCWPFNLSVFYQHPNARYFAPRQDVELPASDQWPGWAIALSVVFLLTITVLAVRFHKRKPWFAMGWFWYLGTLVPVIGVLQVGAQAMADRYTYIPLVGIFICLVWGAAELLSEQPLGRPALISAAVLATVACALATHQQVKYWRNNLTLFTHALQATRHNALAHYQVGRELGSQGQFEPALAHFERALKDDPCFTDAYDAAGITQELLNKPGKAEEAYRDALRIKPWLDGTHVRLAKLLWKEGKATEAFREYREALRYNRFNREAQRELAIALEQSGQTREAEQQLVSALEADPRSVPARTQLAELFLKQGRLDEAEAQFRNLVNLSPGNSQARVNLAGLLWRRGQRNEAAAQYREILRATPRQPVAHYNLGVLLSEQSDLAAAREHLAEAIRLDPSYVEARTALGRLLAGQGELAEALKQFREAVRLSPTNANLQLNLGSALLLAGQTNDAAGCFAEARRLQPDLALSLARAANAKAAQGKFREALASYSQALRLEPDSPVLLDGLAKILSAPNVPELRNATEAARLAERACRLTNEKDPNFLSTLAGAYAAAGRFTEAIGRTEQARSLALSSNQKELADTLQQQLQIYRRQQNAEHPVAPH